MIKATFLVTMLLLSGSVWGSKLVICNQEDRNALIIASVYFNHPLKPFLESWNIGGWLRIPPGQCDWIVQHKSGVEAFLSVVEEYPSGSRHIMHFPFNQSLPNVKTAERFFCVKKGKHERTLQSLKNHRVCPAGWHLQLFNLYITFPHTTNYTLRLGK